MDQVQNLITLDVLFTLRPR